MGIDREKQTRERYFRDLEELGIKHCIERVHELVEESIYKGGKKFNYALYYENRADIMYNDYGVRVIFYGEITTKTRHILAKEASIFRTLPYRVRRKSTDEELQEIANDIISELRLSSRGVRLRKELRKSSKLHT